MELGLRKSIIEHLCKFDMTTVEFSEGCRVSYSVINRIVNHGKPVSFITECKILSYLEENSPVDA